MLCRTCEAIFIGGGTPVPSKPSWRYHHTSYSSFKLAKEQGCRLCNELWVAFHGERDLIPQARVMILTFIAARITSQNRPLNILQFNKYFPSFVDVSPYDTHLTASGVQMVDTLDWEGRTYLSAERHVLEMIPTGKDRSCFSKKRLTSDYRQRRTEGSGRFWRHVEFSPKPPRGFEMAGELHTKPSFV